MKISIPNSKTRENLLLTFLIIFKSTQASVLAFTPETTILCLLYAAYVFWKRGLKLDKFFIPFVLIYSLIQCYYYVSFGDNDFYLGFYILLKLVYAYLTIKCVGMDFFACYEKVVYKLAFISLPLFVIQLIDYDALFKVVGILQTNIPFLEYRNDRLANCIVFTLESHGSITRNSGFAWEPKGFANFLVIAILINLVNNRFRYNKRFLILALALITTTSTVGYLIFFVLIPGLYVFNSKSSKRFLFVIAAIPVVAGILSLDFGLSKIQKEYDGRNEYKELLADEREFEQRSLGRFPSFMLDLQDALKRPLFGYGYNRDERTQSDYTKLVRVNGVSDYFATHGFVGFFLLILTYYKSFKSFLSNHNYSGAWIIMLIIISIYFASTLTSHPFWMIFHFMFLVKMDPRLLVNKYQTMFR